MADNLKIVSLHSGKSVEAGDAGIVPVDVVVRRLEYLLEQAKSGRLRAMCCAVVWAGGRTAQFRGWDPNEPVGHSLAASISYAFHNYMAEMYEDSSPESVPGEEL